MSSYKAAGRLGNPDMNLATDPRTNANLLAFMAALGTADIVPEALTITPESPFAEIEAHVKLTDEGAQGFYDGIPCDTPRDKNEPEVERKDITIPGLDGNELKLHVWRPAESAGKTLPCVVYIHGGGMAILKTLSKVHERWCKSLALAGSVAIAIDFRNAYTPEGHNPFPAGLNDCVAGVKYITSHKSELGIGKVVIQGESGGGNLVLAVALRANREGWVSSIDGVFACCPYISCAWHLPEEKRLVELPSSVENDGYVISVPAMALLAHYYTPDAADKTNPLAWPYYATQADLKGLPPHVLLMDELDPLRDEGSAYYRKLVQAGVPVTASVNLGVVHAASLGFRTAVPELNRVTVTNIVAFAKAL